MRVLFGSELRAALPGYDSHRIIFRLFAPNHAIYFFIYFNNQLNKYFYSMRLQNFTMDDLSSTSRK
jgi:hypothetical protein